jgi:hypothetical protein
LTARFCSDGTSAFAVAVEWVKDLVEVAVVMSLLRLRGLQDR